MSISVDSLLEGVQVIDRQWRYVSINSAGAAHGQRGAAELVGRAMSECYPGIEDTDLFHTLKCVMDTRRPETLRNEFTFPSGEHRWFELAIAPVPEGICVLSLDVTERRQAEFEVHHAQRMEALGKLAGGIAHDFNNQLTAILGFTELLLETQTEDSARRDLQAIKEAAHRSASLTRQLLAFSRRQRLHVEPVDVNEVVRNVDRLLERLLGEDIAREVRLPAAPTMVVADARQLENVLTNLAVNARDAMPQGGRLTITTDTVEFTEEDARQHPTMTSGRYTVLSVSDTGHGMDEGTRARAFEPFFTTKAAGHGTGLGLSMVYGIVTQMKGFVWLYSEPGRGTTVRLYLPTTDQPPQRRTETVISTSGSRPATILVVEDDPQVRELVLRALTRGGHTVIEAANADEARRHAAALVRPPDLVLADVVLPDQSGPDFLRDLTPRPVRVLFMSGYSERQISEKQIQEHGTAGQIKLLEKPFTARDLIRAVDDALASEPAQT